MAAFRLQMPCALCPRAQRQHAIGARGSNPSSSPLPVRQGSLEPVITPRLGQRPQALRIRVITRARRTSRRRCLAKKKVGRSVNNPCGRCGKPPAEASLPCSSCGFPVVLGPPGCRLLVKAHPCDSGPLHIESTSAVEFSTGHDHFSTELSTAGDFVPCTGPPQAADSCDYRSLRPGGTGVRVVENPMGHPSGCLMGSRLKRRI